MKLPIALLFGLAAAITTASAADNRTATASRQSLAINGVACPEALGWSGGEPVATLATSPVAGASAKKQVTGVTYEPITIEAGLPLSPALLECLADLCANRATPRSLLLTTQTATGVGSTIKANDALLTAVRFPALDGASKEALRLTFVFLATSTGPAEPPADTDSKPRKLAALVSNFRLTLDGLPTARVARIEPFAITRPAADKSSSVSRAKTAPFIATVIPDLAIHFGQADLAGWAVWRDTFLVKGDHADSSEKDGVLEFLSADLKTPLLTLRLSHVGLLSLSVPPPEAERIVGARADLYCETISITPDSAKAPAKDATR